MNLRRLVPDELKNYFHLHRTRAHNPQAWYIDSPYVNKSATLGPNVGIAREVVINANVAIGKSTYINRGTIVFSGEIGKYCSIAHNVMIGGEEHPIDRLSTSPRVYLDAFVDTQREVGEFLQPPHIGSDVWIGASAVVLQGVHIGHGAVIGAGAVVTKDIAPFSVAAGVPARPIRKRFDEDIVEGLLEARWWDLSDNDLSLMLRETSDNPRSVLNYLYQHNSRT